MRPYNTIEQMIMTIGDFLLTILAMLKAHGIVILDVLLALHCNSTLLACCAANIICVKSTPGSSCVDKGTAVFMVILPNLHAAKAAIVDNTFISHWDHPLYNLSWQLCSAISCPSLLCAKHSRCSLQPMHGCIMII